MRILIITFDPPENIGGVEGRAKGYVAGLERAGEFVEIEALAPSYKSSVEKFNGTRLYKESSSGRAALGTVRATLGLMRRDSIDTTFLLSGGLTIFGAMMLCYCRITGKRTAVLFYGKDVLQSKRSYLGRFLLFASQTLANRVLANSRYTSSLLLGSSRRKTALLYPSVNPRSTPEIGASPKSDQRPTILFVGRLVKRKGVADLIDAFRLLLTDFPRARLEVVGDGPERAELERMVSDLGLVGSVTFTGSLRGDALYERYRDCDVFAMPSKTLEDDVEGFGTVFLEAGLFGKPSVGTFSGGVPEAVLDGQTGILAREGDVGELAESLRKLLSDERLRLELGRRARERVLAEFTFDRGIEQLVRILKRPTTGRTPPN